MMMIVCFGHSHQDLLQFDKTVFMIVYKYRSGRGVKDNNGNDVFERDIHLLSQDTIYVPTVEQLNDPSEALVDYSVFNLQCRFLTRLISKETIDRLGIATQDLCKTMRMSGIYSLSKENANELMWAYYANGHNGYAIIFDTDVLAKSFEYGKYGGMYEFDVKYSSKLPRFDISVFDKNDNKGVLLCFIGHKSIAWKHEAEHRLLFDKGGKCLKIDYRAIKGFVFGCRMNSDDIDYVMKMFSGRDLDYYQIKMKKDSYELKLDRISDKYPSTDKYCPNQVDYDLEELLEYDKHIDGVGYKYRAYVDEALKEVSREPFVVSISHIVTEEGEGKPRVTVWTKIKQDGLLQKKRSFEFEIIDGLLVRI